MSGWSLCAAILLVDIRERSVLALRSKMCTRPQQAQSQLPVASLLAGAKRGIETFAIAETIQFPRTLARSSKQRASPWYVNCWIVIGSCSRREPGSNDFRRQQYWNIPEPCAAGRSNLELAEPDTSPQLSDWPRWLQIACCLHDFAWHESPCQKGFSGVI